MKLGAQLRILVQFDSARFAAEVARVLAATRYAERDNQYLSSGYVQDCLIVEGTTDAWARTEKYAVAKNMLALVLGGPSLKNEQCQRTARLSFPVEPETLEWFLDQLSASAWRLTGHVENRAHERYHCVAPLGSDWQLIDISEGGCQIEAPYKVSVGTVCPVLLDRAFPKLTNPFNVRVLKVREAPASGCFRLHGCFLLPSDYVRKELHSWLAEIDMVFVGAKPPTKTILDEARGGIVKDRGDSEALLRPSGWG